MNPFNPEAGATPAPTDPVAVAVVEQAALATWRAFPYFAWRFGDRGRAFGRSDAGFLTTLVALPPLMQQGQIDWLARLLAARGMPSLLLEAQLALLGRIGLRRGWTGASALAARAAELRARRIGVMPHARIEACERHFRACAAPLRRHSAGAVIAAEVVDQRLGLVTTPEAAFGWLLAYGPEDPRWRRACLETLALAQASP